MNLTKREKMEAKTVYVVMRTIVFGPDERFPEFRIEPVGVFATRFEANLAVEEEYKNQYDTLFQQFFVQPAIWRSRVSPFYSQT